MSLMLSEIREQPTVLDRTLRAELRGFEALRSRLEASPPRMILLAARGTSDNAAQFGRYLIEITTGIPVSLAAPSIFTLYRSPLNLDGCLVVAVSQSGESTDTNVVLEEAKAQGAFTIGITNEAGSSLAALADHTVLVRAGRERSVAATKTYAGQLLTFYMLAWALGAKLDISDLKRLPSLVESSLELEKEIAQRAERYRFMDHAVVIGRGLNYSNAFEWALKLMETCYIIAERFSQADILHGPIAMVEHSFPAFVLAPPGPTWPVMEPMIQRLAALDAETLVLTDRSNKAVPKNAVRIPALLEFRSKKQPGMPADLYTPIPYIVPAQLFAAYLAAVKGLNPDAPRGLKKVTQTL
jgi:glucosamine--fructose-6-phosphate aminotransferase (isomerizing)